ncbi:MAG: PilW family protein [Gammaproteobacteria bacterium]|nr:PilW family protein [Gammaproteobacteria bacterium]
MRNLSQSRSTIMGFTLIELLISMAIGTFLIAGVFKVFSNGRVAQGAIELQTQLIDDARFSLRTLSYDLRHAGLWGRTNNDSEIAGAVGVDPAFGRSRELTDVYPTLAGDCAADWYRNLNESFFVSENSNPYADTCIPSDQYVPNTDVLVVKYAPPAPIADADLAANVVYIYANSFHGELFIGPTAPQFSRDIADLVPQNFRLKARTYFVNKFTDFDGDNYPSLHRVELAIGPSLTNTMLIPGVEDLQVQLGWDNDNDGSVDMYVDGNSALMQGVEKIDLSQVKSVQFWVLIRAQHADLLTDASGTAIETQSLSLAGRPAQLFDDGFRRVVMSTVVKLQNRMHKKTATGG